MSEKQPHAVVLLSGGLDSATTLAMAFAEGFVCHGVTFDYGQRHRVELDAAVHVAKAFDVASHRVLRIDLRSIGGSSLTDDIAVPKDRDPDRMGSGIPVTYVPARNTIFLSYALAVAEVSGSSAIFMGVNALDYSGYPDCRPEYIDAFQSLANLAIRAAVEGRPISIHTPLIRWRKKRIIQEGLRLGVDYGMTFSCYDPIIDASRALGAYPCRRCDSCQLRARAFEELGLDDPGL